MLSNEHLELIKKILPDGAIVQKVAVRKDWAVYALYEQWHEELGLWSQGFEIITPLTYKYSYQGMEPLWEREVIKKLGGKE